MNMVLKSRQELRDPTVQDVINALLKLPPTATFAIMDPDTGWVFRIFEIKHELTTLNNEQAEEVFIATDYSDLNVGL